VVNNFDKHVEGNLEVVSKEGSFPFLHVVLDKLGGIVVGLKSVAYGLALIAGDGVEKEGIEGMEMCGDLGMIEEDGVTD
jgi:hypothetical protein